MDVATNALAYTVMHVSYRELVKLVMFRSQNLHRYACHDHSIVAIGSVSPLPQR